MQKYYSTKNLVVPSEYMLAIFVGTVLSSQAATVVLCIDKRFFVVQVDKRKHSKAASSREIQHE